MNPWLENTRWLRYTLLILGSLGGVLLFLLASASSNTDFFESNYPLLITLNGIIAAGLFSILALLIVRMVRRYRAGVFGSRLMLRMSLSFALMGLIPGFVLYLVSVQFLAKSIDSWFDVRVDGALESGLNLGQTALDSLINELALKGQSISIELSRATPSEQLLELPRLRDAANVQELTLLTETGQILGSSGGQLDSLLPSLPTQVMLRQALMTRPFQQIEPDPDDPDGRLYMRVVVPIAPPLTSFDLGQRYVQIMHPVPTTLSQRANAVQRPHSSTRSRARPSRWPSWSAPRACTPPSGRSPPSSTSSPPANGSSPPAGCSGDRTLSPPRVLSLCRGSHGTPDATEGDDAVTQVGRWWGRSP